MECWPLPGEDAGLESRLRERLRKATGAEPLVADLEAALLKCNQVQTAAAVPVEDYRVMVDILGLLPSAELSAPLLLCQMASLPAVELRTRLDVETSATLGAILDHHLGVSDAPVRARLVTVLRGVPGLLKVYYRLRLVSDEEAPTVTLYTDKSGAVPDLVALDEMRALGSRVLANRGALLVEAEEPVPHSPMEPDREPTSGGDVGADLAPPLGPPRRRETPTFPFPTAVEEPEPVQEPEEEEAGVLELMHLDDPPPQPRETPAKSQPSSNSHSLVTQVLLFPVAALGIVLHLFAGLLYLFRPRAVKVAVVALGVTLALAFALAENPASSRWQAALSPEGYPPVLSIEHLQEHASWLLENTVGRAPNPFAEGPYTAPALGPITARVKERQVEVAAAQLDAFVRWHLETPADGTEAAALFAAALPQMIAPVQNGDGSYRADVGSHWGAVGEALGTHQYSTSLADYYDPFGRLLYTLSQASEGYRYEGVLRWFRLRAEAYGVENVRENGPGDCSDSNLLTGALGDFGLEPYVLSPFRCE